MSTPWHQAYLDNDVIFKSLHEMNERNEVEEVKFDMPRDEQETRAAAYFALMRLFTWPSRGGRPWCLGYNEFVAADMCDGSRTWVHLVGHEQHRKDIFHALINVAALALTNTNHAIEACAESENVWSPWEKSGYPPITHPQRLNLIGAYLATGQAELLRENNVNAQRAFSMAWALLQTDPPQAFQSKLGGHTAGPEGSRQSGSAEIRYAAGDWSEDPTFYWFTMPSKLKASEEAEKQGSPSPLSQEVIGSFRTLMTILLAKELGKMELNLATQSSLEGDSERADGHLKNSLAYFSEAESAIDVWRLDGLMSVSHLRAEVMVLQMMARSPGAKFNGMEEVTGLTLKLAPVDVRDAIHVVSRDFAHIEQTSSYAIIWDARSLFTEFLNTESLIKLARKGGISLTFTRALIAFDTAFFKLIDLSRALKTHYMAFKALALEKLRSRPDGVDLSKENSSARRVTVIAMAFGKIKVALPHAPDVLRAMIHLVVTMKEEPHVNLAPIYEVTKDWPDMPDDPVVDALVLELRSLANVQ